MIFCGTGSRTSVENKSFIKFSLSAGTYTIEDFNAKIKTAVLQQEQDWEPPQIKDLKLSIAEHYSFMASNIVFIADGILNKHLEKTTKIRSTLFPGSSKRLLHTAPPKSLSLHCKQFNKVKNELYKQPSSLIACTHVSNYETSFSRTF